MAQSQYEQLKAQVDSLNTLQNLQEEKAVRTDEQVSGTTYVGKAHPGSVTSVAVWQISRVVVTTSLPITTTVTWADGNTSYDNIWDNRTSLSYS
jgi:hypothetical protein|tara:strand:+ start:16012 stop:16293 length:282 start_codon:yes stop_codon:yes gene_type:complete